MVGEKIGSPQLARLCKRLVLYSGLMTTAGLIVGLPERLVWLAPLQPMRHLQLVYALMLLSGGGLLTHYVLRTSAWRWALLFVPLCAGMLYAQRASFPTSAHIELPGQKATNRWVRCFLWIKGNTPQDAYFAINPRYMARPGEEYFGFRAIAERANWRITCKTPRWSGNPGSRSGMETTSGCLARLCGLYKGKFLAVEK